VHERQSNSQVKQYLWTLKAYSEALIAFSKTCRTGTPTDVQRQSIEDAKVRMMAAKRLYINAKRLHAEKIALR
jgi:hypothetical protein